MTGWLFDTASRQWVCYRLGEPFLWVTEEMWPWFRRTHDQVEAPDGWRVPVPCW